MQNVTAYEEIMMEAGLNRFIMSVKQWVSCTNSLAYSNGSSIARAFKAHSEQGVVFNPSSVFCSLSICPLFIFLKAFQSVHNSHMFCVIMFYVILFP